MSRVRGFALDEYVGLPAGHPESYREVLMRTVVKPLGLSPDLVRVPGDELEAMFAAGRIRDAASLAAYGLLLLAEKRRGA